MKKGDRVPDFEGLDQSGETVTLRSLIENGPLVLYFYPKAMTPGWTKESCHFRDLAAEFAELGAQRVGISTDPVDRQKEFDRQNNLGFKLLSDPDKKIASILGAKRRGPLPNQRATYVIGQGQTLLGVIKNEKNMVVHADEALQILKSQL